jgi:hypothetical protein
MLGYIVLCSLLLVGYLFFLFQKHGRLGWKLRQQCLETVTSLVRASRNFFLDVAAAEI